MNNNCIDLTHVLIKPNERHKLDIETFEYEF